MKLFVETKFHRTASLLTFAVLVMCTDAAQAGGVTACENPFIFNGSAANIATVEYLATSVDRGSGRDLQRTAQRLAWLFKLDSWHQPIYGSLGVVAHMFLGRTCDPDEVLEGLIRGRASRPISSGQVVIMLQGRIFIEGSRIFLQSRLRGFRRNNLKRGRADVPSDYFADEDLSVALSGGHRLRASLPLLDITFAPRALTFAELDHIDQRFENVSVVYPQRTSSRREGETLRFERGRLLAFRVQVLDGGEWLRVEDSYGDVSGFIRVDPRASATLHATLPELDFMNGLLGFLRVSQARSGADYPLPPSSAARQARRSLGRFDDNPRAAEDIEARALAFALRGALAAFDSDWRTARERFEAAAGVAPYHSAYRNLLGVADAMLCCGGPSRTGFTDPTRSFTDSLSLAPDNREALLNLDAFLTLLSETPEPPAGIDNSRLNERRAVVRRVVSGFE